MLDYMTGALLMAAPWLLGFYRGGAETWIPVILGAGALLYSLLTNYELSLMRVIPMPVHLAFDLLSGIVLAASPWVFGFASFVMLPHMILGVWEIGASLMTSKQPAILHSARAV